MQSHTQIKKQYEYVLYTYIFINELRTTVHLLRGSSPHQEMCQQFPSSKLRGTRAYTHNELMQPRNTEQRDNEQNILSTIHSHSQLNYLCNNH